MGIQKSVGRKTVKTILVMAALLLAFFFQGAAVAANRLDGAASAVARGLILWAFALITVVFCLIKYKRLNLFGFTRPNRGSFKQLYFFIPLIAVALTGFSNGIAADQGTGTILANLFLSLGIGFCEELYFRGILCNLWLEEGERAAVAISAILFAVCHLMNLAGGAGMAKTMLQICFAFVYGIVFALIFLVCRSIWPCVLLHAFHDFCSFNSAGAWGAVAVGAIQFIVLLCYALALIRRRRKSTAPN